MCCPENLDAGAERAAARGSPPAAVGVGTGERDMGPWYTDGRCSGSTVAVENVSRGRGSASYLTAMRRMRAGARRRMSTSVLNPSPSRSAVAGPPAGLLFSPSLNPPGPRLPLIFLSPDVSRFKSVVPKRFSHSGKTKVSGAVPGSPDSRTNRTPVLSTSTWAGVYFLSSRGRQLAPICLSDPSHASLTLAAHPRPSWYYQVLYVTTDISHVSRHSALFPSTHPRPHDTIRPRAQTDNPRRNCRPPHPRPRHKTAAFPPSRPVTRPPLDVLFLPGSWSLHVLCSSSLSSSAFVSSASEADALRSRFFSWVRPNSLASSKLTCEVIFASYYSLSSNSLLLYLPPVTYDSKYSHILSHGSPR